MKDTIDFLTLYQRLFHVLSSGTIQDVMDVSYEITGVPILAVDIMYNLLGAAPKDKTGDYFWDYLLEHKKYETDITVRLYSEGIMQSVNENESPYIIDWGAATENFPKILGVMKVNDMIEGYVVMQCQKGETTKERMKAMSVIQETCSLLLKDSDSASSMGLAYQRAFINELFNDRIHSQEQLDIWKKGTRLFPEPPYRIIAVNTNNSSEKNVLSYISKSFQKAFPRQILLIQQHVLYILHHGNFPENTDAASKKLRTFLSQFNAYCGISNSFDNLLSISDYQTQATDAMKIGKVLDADNRVYLYEDYCLPAIMMPCIKQIPKNNYISPIITQLREYDEKHSTELLNTLKVYIRNLCNTSDSADELHIHRNSLLYRVNKIEELTDSYLKDYHTFMHLTLSFYIEDLNKIFLRL